MVTESWVLSTWSPMRRSSVAAATGRSLSSKWVWAIPRTVTGPSAKGAIAIRVVATSPIRVKSASTARSRAEAGGPAGDWPACAAMAASSKAASAARQHSTA